MARVMAHRFHERQRVAAIRAPLDEHPIYTAPKADGLIVTPSQIGRHD